MQITNIGNTRYYRPSPRKGLEELVWFPDGKMKRKGIPNSTVWVFSPQDHTYVPGILGNDVGCGMALFMLGNIDPQEAADTFCAALKGKKILGRGNHFIDLCSPIQGPRHTEQNYTTMVLHTDGKRYDNATPTTVEEALSKQRNAATYREKLGTELAKLLNTSCDLVGNWTHNSIERGEKILYRKGCIKVEPEKLHILPAHLGSRIMLYTVIASSLPPYASMPHATGRARPRGDGKVSLAEAETLRQLVYIPPGVATTSLRTEHPSCYHNFDPVLDSLGQHIVPVGELIIKSYVGKI